MHVVSGPVRYFYLRKTSGQEDVPHWPPAVKASDGPENKICALVRLYSGTDGWRAECSEDKVAEATVSEPAFVLTRATVFGLLHEGKRSNAEAELLGVRVTNADSKGVEYVTHFVVRPLSSMGFGAPKHAVVVPVEALVLGEYVERGDHAEAKLDLRMSPQELAGMPPFVADDALLRLAKRAVDDALASTARFYSYGTIAKHGITLEVEAGRVSLHGRVDLTTAGDQARAALLATPGVIEVSDHLLYIEGIKDEVVAALAAKGLDNITVLTEHALVNLRGEVPDSKTRYQAEDIARRIPGVRGVVNDIVVTSPVKS
jgi:hypothetical protein